MENSQDCLGAGPRSFQLLYVDYSQLPAITSQKLKALREKCSLYFGLRLRLFIVWILSPFTGADGYCASSRYRSLARCNACTDDQPSRFTVFCSAYSTYFGCSGWKLPGKLPFIRNPTLLQRALILALERGAAGAIHNDR